MSFGRRCAAFVVLLSMLTAAASGLELEQGRIRLVLHEDVGRFSLYYLEDIRQDRYVPLFFDGDPRTSMLSLFADNSVYRMGDTGTFELRTISGDGSATFVWTSALLQVRQQFELIRGRDSRLADGVQIELTITNVSERSLTVGAAYVIDTSLGEHADAHFRSSTGNTFAGEARLDPGDGVNSWVSPAESFPDVGLQCMMAGEAVTTPSHVIFANWKRLSERPWAYEINPNRDFNLLPYSINDSAAAVYYEKQPLEPGASRQIVTRLGNYSKSGFAVVSREQSTEDQLLDEAAGPDEASRSAGPQPYEDLVRVNDILEEVNRMLEEESEPSEESMQVLERALESLQRKYESR